MRIIFECATKEEKDHMAYMLDALLSHPSFSNKNFWTQNIISEIRDEIKFCKKKTWGADAFGYRTRVYRKEIRFGSSERTNTIQKYEDYSWEGIRDYNTPIHCSETKVEDLDVWTKTGGEKEFKPLPKK
jgi:hypothetical protein